MEENEGSESDSLGFVDSSSEGEYSVCASITNRLCFLVTNKARQLSFQ